VQPVGEQREAGVEECESVGVPDGKGVSEAGHHQHTVGHLLGMGHGRFDYRGRLTVAVPHLGGLLEDRGLHHGSFR
jgi:hypothetical protein